MSGGKMQCDFKGKSPKEVLSPSEIKRFEEGMCLKNKSGPANMVNFATSVKMVAQGLKRLLP